jgi:MFS transporter, CP family, cyanate transporter
VGDRRSRGGRAAPARALTADGRERLLLLFAILLAAFNLRIGIAEIGPVVDQIRADTGMNRTLAGALTMIPFLCMGAFSFAGPGLFARGGPTSVITASLALIALGTVLRAVAPTAGLILLATVPLGVGIALLGVTLPPLVKEAFPARAGAVTGAYVAALSGGLAATALLIVPLGDALGGWRPAFAATAIPALGAWVLWLVIGASRPSAGAGPAVRRTRFGRTEALLAGSFALEAICFSSMVGWMAAIYLDAGWSESSSSAALAAIGFITVPTAILVGPLSDGSDRRSWVAGSAGVMSIGLLGVALAPTDLGAAWVVLFSLGSGASFALLLALPLDLATTPMRVSGLASWMLGIGYGMSALGPLMVGALRDVTGGFGVPVAIVAVLGIGSGALALMLPKPGDASARSASDPRLP